MSARGVSVDEVIEVLARLVRSDSSDPPGDASGPAAVLCEILRREGIEHEILESRHGVCNVVARLRGRRAASTGTERTLLLNGHIDTVPPGEGWTVDPFGAEIRDGCMFGRGTVDMKAGIAAALMSLVHLKRNDSPFAGTAILTAVGDEEYHGELGTKWLIGRGLSADAAVVCEPTNLDLCLGNRGLLMVDITTRGVASHAGRPALGRNAISLAVKLVSALESMSFEGGRDDRFKDPVGSLSVVSLHGGSRINVIPHHCELTIDRRLTPKETGAEAIAQIRDLIERVTGVSPAAVDDGTAEVVMIPEVWHEPFWIDEGDDFVRQCFATYRRLFSGEPAVEGKSAGTDASHLTRMAGIPTVIFGPGDYRRSHTVDERVELSQLIPAVRFYCGLIESVLKGEE